MVELFLISNVQIANKAKTTVGFLRILYIYMKFARYTKKY